MWKTRVYEDWIEIMRKREIKFSKNEPKEWRAKNFFFYVQCSMKRRKMVANQWPDKAYIVFFTSSLKLSNQWRHSKFDTIAMVDI